MNEEAPEITARLAAETAEEEAREFLNPCFLGSYGENNDVFERLLLEFLRDHVYWRRNFHPEDQPPIPTLALHQPRYMEFVDSMKTELHRLTASLKRSVPFFNPRYMGHMVSDTLLPGLLAQMITTLYNPNNVVEEAAPVTLDMELKVGLQLARMFGFASDPKNDPCAWGHLTGGGTVANYESLLNQRNLRFFPLALQAAAEAEQVGNNVALTDGRLLGELNGWQCLNLPLEEIIHLRQAFLAHLDQELRPARARIVRARLESERIENLGIGEFFRRHPEAANTVVMAPVTAHYSWAKAMKVFGFGKRQLVAIPVDDHMRMDAEALDRALADAEAARQPVLSVVAVLGSTEFGTIDPVHRVVALRERWRKRGMDFGIHVDAAWGGYLASLFRNENGTLRSREETASELRHFPSEAVHSSFAALRDVDSITVDPHKLGFLPFGVGGIVWRDRRVNDFISERAAYVFEETGEPPSPDARYRNLGQYILEGSKPGSVAAAAYVTHRVLPLDHTHFGRFQQGTIAATEYFHDALPEVAERLRGEARLIVPFEPDTNLICLAINPEGNTSLARMNTFGWRLYRSLRTDGRQPVQLKEFFGSHTSVYKDMLSETEMGRLLDQLGIEPSTFAEDVEDPALQAESIFLLRHTLMNPWLTKRTDGLNYLDRYCRYLEMLIRRELDTVRQGWRL
ncbi:MAG: pyridoxal-dependent decarboxylase [Gammaproteobacteria bacterium]